MKNINEYSEKELKKLHSEFCKLKVYKGKVEYVYSHFGKLYGSIKAVNSNFDFSIKPIDEHENRIRWMFYFDSKKEETFKRFKSDHEMRFKNAPNKVKFLGDSLCQIRNNSESNSNIKYGYEMGSLAKGLDWIHWDQNIDWSENLRPYYEGLAYYMLEQWLNGLKEETSVDEDWIGDEEKLSIAVLVALVKQIGLIEHLYEKFPRLNNNKKNLAYLLSKICRVDKKDFINLYKTLTNAINETTKWTPNDDAVSAILLKAEAIPPPIKANSSRKKKKVKGD